MADPAKPADTNRPALALHVPEPRYRPGDKADFSHIDIGQPGDQPRPDEGIHPSQMAGLAYGLVRVLGDDNQAHGPWNPRLSPDTLRAMLGHMAMVRAFDERMFRGQRQGKTSFYMKCTGEEATSIAPAMALASDDMVFPSYRQQGILIARGYPMVDMINQIYSNKADKLKGRQLPIMYSSREQASFFSDLGQSRDAVCPQAGGLGDGKRDAGAIARIAAASWLGEGSTAEGDFHSAMHLCRSLQRAGGVQCCQQPVGDFELFGICRGGAHDLCRARASAMASRRCGSMAMIRWRSMPPTAWAADRARGMNGGPTLIEHFTYRAEGHSTSDDPSGSTVRARSVTEWPLGDPVLRLARSSR